MTITNPYDMKYNSTVVSEPIVRSDGPQNHNKKRSPYTWGEIYHMKKRKKKALTLEGRLLGITQVWVKVLYWIERIKLNTI